MIEKVFKNVQSMNLLSYSMTCGFGFEKFISGKGMYGNRVSTIRSKDPKKLYSNDNDFKNSEFITIEGIKSLELPTTIANTRQRIESFFTSEECMFDFLATFKTDFLNDSDIRVHAHNWYEKVSTKLLANNILDFSKLNNFLLGSIVLYLPLPVQMKVAQFRQEQILTYLTQDIISADFAKAQLDLLPCSKEKLVILKQKLIRQRSEMEANRVASYKAEEDEEFVKQVRESVRRHTEGEVYYNERGKLMLKPKTTEEIDKKSSEVEKDSNAMM